MPIITVLTSILAGLSLTLDEEELVPRLHKEVLLPLGVVSMEVCNGEKLTMVSLNSLF